MQAIADELRSVDYKATGTLQRTLDHVGRMSRGEFDGLLDAMTRAGLIEIEEAEFEKNGEVIRFRKVRLTESGLELRASSPVELLISDGVVEEFGRDFGAGKENEERGEERIKAPRGRRTIEMIPESNSTEYKHTVARPGEAEAKRSVPRNFQCNFHWPESSRRGRLQIRR